MQNAGGAFRFLHCSFTIVHALARADRGGFLALCRFFGGLAARGGLRAVLLVEPLDTALGVEQLLLAREERVAARADFEVQFGLGRPGLPRGAARAADVNGVVLRVNGFFHGVLLVPQGLYGETPIISPALTHRPYGANEIRAPRSHRCWRRASRSRGARPSPSLTPRLRSTCRSRRIPGITVLMAGCSRMKRSASSGRSIPSGTSGSSRSTRVRVASRCSLLEYKLRQSPSGHVDVLVNVPVRLPSSNGTRAITAMSCCRQ